jgi:hypothetical protein
VGSWPGHVRVPGERIAPTTGLHNIGKGQKVSVAVNSVFLEALVSPTSAVLPTKDRTNRIITKLLAFMISPFVKVNSVC